MESAKSAITVHGSFDAVLRASNAEPAATVSRNLGVEKISQFRLASDVTVDRSSNSRSALVCGSCWGRCSAHEWTRNTSTKRWATSISRLWSLDNKTGSSWSGKINYQVLWSGKKPLLPKLWEIAFEPSGALGIWTREAVPWSGAMVGRL